MQDVRAMLVEHALGIARRPAGITKPDRIALAERHPLEPAVLGRDQVAVGQIALLRRRVEQHEMLDARKLIAQSLDDRQKGRVEEQHPVRGMVDDIHKLFVEQPRIDGMQRSEEHTSELQSLMRISYAVFCLKKKKDKHE